MYILLEINTARITALEHSSNVVLTELTYCIEVNPSINLVILKNTLRLCNLLTLVGATWCFIIY